MAPHSYMSSNDAFNESWSGHVPHLTQNPMENTTLDTEFLIVGCGPAGASLACFLSSHGLKGIMVGSASGTADTPRAHITNMAAVECLRDIGLDREIEAIANKSEHMVHTRWCHSMAGEEYARLHAWGNDPDRKGDYERASPCKIVDLPQTLLEPILIRYATAHGFKVRFDTTLEHFREDEETNTITVTVRDRLSGNSYEIRTRYMFGADGARSQVVRQLGLPMETQPVSGLAINVLVKADLSHLVDSRKGNLHWIMQPDKEHPSFGWAGIARMVKKWDEWMFVLMPDKDADLETSPPTRDEYMARIRDFIGDDTPADIINISQWKINDIVAKTYSKGNVFCLGDAVHRHPPTNGLGSNTCIQDAFNLAWKIAYVHQGKADASLLSTYSIERQPVGRSIVNRANQAFKDHLHVWNAIGATLPNVDDRREVLREFKDPGEKGQARRRDFRQAIKGTTAEFHALGLEMGQQYTGLAVYTADEQEPFQRSGLPAKDPVLYLHRSTYPGSRLPHVWLNKAVPEAPKSTVDITGHGQFTILTGIGGEAWHAAAREISERLDIPIVAHTIGFRQEWEDVYFDWDGVRGVEESGAVLVRPDRFVAWRANKMLESEAACATKLSIVMKSILGMSGEVRPL